MFARNGPTEPNGFAEDFIECNFRPMNLVFIPLIRQTGRMEIAVTGMPEVSKGQIMVRCDFIDALQHRSDFAPWNSSIFQNCRRSNAGECGKRCLTRSPQ